MPVKKKDIQKNRIRELRMARGLSSGQLAEKIKALPSQMSRLEKGQQRLTMEWLAKLTKALGVTSDEIVGLPVNPKVAADRDDALHGAAIGWLVEAAEKSKVKLSPRDLSKWAAYICN